MLRLPKNLHTALRHLSIDRGISLNALLTEVLEDWWAKQPERKKYQA
jgi:predicted HicB family RNase H-like nuclease